MTRSFISTIIGSLVFVAGCASSQKPGSVVPSAQEEEVNPPGMPATIGRPESSPEPPGRRTSLRGECDRTLKDENGCVDPRCMSGRDLDGVMCKGDPRATP